ncbi:MAG: hypothetical protein KGM97_01315 [Alphaproteobacteria bacterium]|nr:hypothetical protein [Alphaproteobacteria bacterium]MDE2629603.1 hypothetical protein [Alphaproteobacteria bacterium]
MRIGVVALAVLVAAGIGAAVAVAQANRTPAPVRAAQTSAPAAAPMLARGVKQFDASYHSHRDQFVKVSEYSERMRENWLLGAFGFAVFVLLTVPKNARGVRAFYRQMMERSPLSAETDATDDDNRQARKVLFFYLLFLLYQLVEFPLTIGHDKGIPFYADLIFQTSLLLAVVWAFHGLQRGLRQRWRSDPGGREKMDRWLDEKLEGINIRWRNIRKLAVGVFVAGFAPAALSHLTGWLDVATDFGERVVGS